MDASALLSVLYSELLYELLALLIDGSKWWPALSLKCVNSKSESIKTNK